MAAYRSKGTSLHPSVRTEIFNILLPNELYSRRETGESEGKVIPVHN